MTEQEDTPEIADGNGEPEELAVWRALIAHRDSLVTRIETARRAAEIGEQWRATTARVLSKRLDGSEKGDELAELEDLEHIGRSAAEPTSGTVT